MGAAFMSARMIIALEEKTHPEENALSQTPLTTPLASMKNVSRPDTLGEYCHQPIAESQTYLERDLAVACSRRMPF